MHDIFKLFLFRTDRGERCVNLLPNALFCAPSCPRGWQGVCPTVEMVLLAVGIGWLTDHRSRKGVGEMKGTLSATPLSSSLCWKNNASSIDRHLEIFLLPTIFSHKITDIIIHSNFILVPYWSTYCS